LFIDSLSSFNLWRVFLAVLGAVQEIIFGLVMGGLVLILRIFGDFIMHDFIILGIGCHLILGVGGC
jgi:hypothetical protein